TKIFSATNWNKIRIDHEPRCVDNANYQEKYYGSKNKQIYSDEDFVK
uniref:Uncharacterized protein n=1 Tax=Panagrolaimus sp. ES5 TaxID=591445 RepID=A0AC34FME1_9BILA